MKIESPLPCISCAELAYADPAKGLGFQGSSFESPLPLQPRVGCVKERRACIECLGSGRVKSFVPYIFVVASFQRPTSITAAAFTAAAFTAATWRYLSLPDQVIRAAMPQQRQWVSDKVATHFVERRGLCPLFGKIMKYRWFVTKHVSFEFSVHGELISKMRFAEYLRLEGK
jgi:hypothetical protein